MRYSQLTGVLAALAVIAICYLPWTYIASHDILITGFNSGATGFGKPGLLNIIFSLVCAVFFAIPKIWAKRTNVFIAAINFAWSFRNYLLLTACEAGECPEKRIGLYLLLITSLIIQLMTFFPDIKIPEEKS